MNLPPTPHTLALTALVVVASSSCSPMHMQAPDGLAAVPVHEVGGAFSDGHLDFGQWKTIKVDRDWTSASSTTIAASTARSASQGYRFTLARDGEPTFDAECSTSAESSGVDLGNMNVSRGSQTLACKFRRAGGGEEAATLSVNLTRGGEGGQIDLGERVLEVIPVHQTDDGGDHPAALGYAVFEREEVVAAVQTWGDPRVWMASAPTTEGDADLVATAIAALALHREVSPD